MLTDRLFGLCALLQEILFNVFVYFDVVANHSSVIGAQVVLKLKILFSSGLWNLVFLFSNLSLVFLMPFAYFFTESEGFAGSKKVATMSVAMDTLR